jgi:hypothetical protein
LRIGATPSAVEIAGEILDVQRIGNLTVRQTLAKMKSDSSLIPALL